MLASAFFLVNVGVGSVTIHLVPFATDIGFSPHNASIMLSSLGAFNMISGITFGLLAEKFSLRYVTMLCFFLEALGILCLMRLTPESLEIFFLFLLLYGISYGGKGPLLPLITGEYFGLGSFAEIYGYLMAAFILGQGVGGFVAGYIFDLFHSYYWLFILISIGFILATLLIYFVQPLKNAEGHPLEFTVSMEGEI